MTVLEKLEPGLLVAFEGLKIGGWAVERVQVRLAENYGFTEADCRLGHWALTKNDLGGLIEMTTHGINFRSLPAGESGVRFFRHPGIVTAAQQKECVRTALVVALGRADKRRKYDWGLIVNEWLGSFGMEPDINIENDLICTEFPYAVWIAMGMPVETDNFLPAMAGVLGRSGRLEEVSIANW